MLGHINPENLICIDIETVPAHPDFGSLPDELKELYLKKSERLKHENENEEEQYFNHAGIYAEFGKIICITLGLFKKEKGEYHIRIKSLCSDDEKKVLQDFAAILMKHPRRNRLQFCGHNIREFDIPFLCRRFLIHHLDLAEPMDISGRKPWDVNMVDTMQLWRFGDIKHFTSIKLLALILGIESPKNDIDGKDVGRVYWKEKNLQRIVEYCQRDVITVAQLVMRFKGLPLLQKEQIVITG
jgi:uncharacterized protein YprB with RNaseH-like and TPR domain